jgi:hypothetical protein
VETPLTIKDTDVGGNVKHKDIVRVKG